ncbi:glycine--tRNA ligase subunit beta [Jannaschia helgolandensis]|uniref:glycine--tRNA ligase subunit beta n=1 Tax=Jannaschia helgolandensis TaxID=188906 RepID=UPI0030D73559
MSDLLIELFSEEIPARMQRRAADDLKRLVTDGLVEGGLTYAGAIAHCTPRRLTLSIHGLTDESPTTTEDRKGPKVGAPEKALDGFLRSTGLTQDQLVVADDKKGQVYMARITKPGRAAPAIVAEVLEAAVRGFPWPKSMRWGTGSLKWVRPLRSILCILVREDGAEIVPLDIDGIVSGDTTEGHRFMAPGRFAVKSFDDYEAKLKRAKVVLSSEERADAIWQDATNQAFAAGLEVVEDKGLLDEVAGLVEWPVVLMGEIGADYLDLPSEVLQTSMKEHQKFFSVRNKSGKIVCFITVANRETADHGATILAGNNKVLSARLADAKFFWENDLRIAKAGGDDWAAPWLDALGNVTFHAKLGSQAKRIDRIAALAREIAPAVDADPDLAERAARLAKADLSSEMVYEFPELQGLMGRYYAQAAGEAPEVAAAAQEHYSPLGPSDDVPTAPVSVAVALADKLDTLAGFWWENEKPTGSKDPFALRRAALGVIRLVLQSEQSLPLGRIISSAMLPFEENARKRSRIALQSVLAAADGLPDPKSDPLDILEPVDKKDRIEPRLSEENILLRESLLAYFHDRLKGQLREEGVRYDVFDLFFDGTLSMDFSKLVARARALNAFLATDNGENLMQGYRRAKNILTQAEEQDGVEYSYGAERKLAETDEERALFDAIEAARPRIDAALASEDYPVAMTALADLRAPVDAFFEAVQVNADTPILRRNRLNMLSEIVRTCTKIADLSRISA